MKKTIKYYLIFCILYVIVTSLFACSPVKELSTFPGTTIHNTGTPEQWEQFESCISDHPSDIVCDSCYKAIFN